MLFINSYYIANTFLYGFNVKAKVFRNWLFSKPLMNAFVLDRELLMEVVPTIKSKEGRLLREAQ